MTSHLTTAVRAALLLTALEPGAPRERIEGALVLLGHRAAGVDDACTVGLLRRSGDRLEVTDPRVARSVVGVAEDRERRAAHLALACLRMRGPESRRMFDALSAALDSGIAPRAEPSVPTRTPLTPQERHVAELAATGARTREIAQASFLSQKTVEYHLTRVYRKLGVRSKAELAFAFRAG
jgi:DNA-binding CsgD family transcriptional regulator